MANVLISGGTGLIGRALVKKLQDKGYSVGVLSRSGKKDTSTVRFFLWDPDNNSIDQEAVDWADHIISLAGENVAQRWTSSAKKRILDSRIDGTLLFRDALAKRKNLLKSFISSSAIGYYGSDTGDAELDEQSPLGTGFLAEVVDKWEGAIDECAPYAERTVKVRTGIVLANEGGALKKMITPIKFGIGSPLGSGKQWMSWVHISDLVNMYVFALESSIKGVFNGVAPNPEQNQGFSEQLAKVLGKPFFFPNVPGFVLKLLLGDMSSMVLGGNRVLPIAFQQEGFKFEYNKLDEALAALL
jgi:uncharacterized protein (TIGR01777 family)